MAAFETQVPELSSDSLKSSLLRQVERTTVLSDPFVHFLLGEAFDFVVYRQLLEMLPPIEAYEPFSHADSIVHGRPTRYQLHLNGDGIAKMPAHARSFWADIGAQLGSVELKIAIFEKLGVEPQISTTTTVLLVRDLDGYCIKPHPDISEKIITSQYFLAQNSDRPHIGTEFYTKRDGHFIRTKMVPYQPNHGYAFKVAPHSWHGVPRNDLTTGGRDSIMTIYYRA